MQATDNRTVLASWKHPEFECCKQLAGLDFNENLPWHTGALQHQLEALHPPRECSHPDCSGSLLQPRICWSDPLSIICQYMHRSASGFLPCSIALLPFRRLLNAFKYQFWWNHMPSQIHFRGTTPRSIFACVPDCKQACAAHIPLTSCRFSTYGHHSAHAAW